MEWLLVSVVCAVFGPADVRCETRAVVQPSKVACLKMIRPQREYLTSEAEAQNMEPVHLFVGCKYGTVI